MIDQLEQLQRAYSFIKLAIYAKNYIVHFSILKGTISRFKMHGSIQ